MIDPLPILVEGIVDQAVVQRLLDLTGLPRDPEVTVAGGKERFRKYLKAWNHAARNGGARLALRDLDHDAACPKGLIDQLLPNRCQTLCLRVAIRETESWLLADAEGMAKFFGINPSNIPAQPETLDKPKAAVMDLARRSRKGKLRDGMIPDPRSGRTEGPAYTGYMIEFIQSLWSPDRAMERAPSLGRAVARLKRLKGTGAW